MMYDPAEENGLAKFLSACLAGYEDEFRGCWALDRPRNDGELYATEHRCNAALYEVAKAVAGGLETLGAGGGVRDRFVQYLQLVGVEEPGSLADRMHVEGLFRFPVVRDLTLIYLASDAVEGRLPDAGRRVSALVTLYGARQLGERSIAYLQRVIRLYVWGFDSEAVVMCRSVLEAALADRLEPLIQPDTKAPSLEDMIGLAGEGKVLGGYTKATNRRGWKAAEGSELWWADQLRMTGNRAIHNLPVLDPDRGGIKDAADAIQALIRILDRLFPPQE